MRDGGKQPFLKIGISNWYLSPLKILALFLPLRFRKMRFCCHSNWLCLEILDWLYFYTFSFVSTLFFNTKAKIQHLNSTHHRVFWVFESSGGRLASWGPNLAKVVKGMEAVVGFGFKQELYQNFPGDPIYKYIKSDQYQNENYTFLVFFCLTISIPLSFCVLCFALLFCLGYFFWFFLAPLMFYLLHCSRF